MSTAPRKPASPLIRSFAAAMTLSWSESNVYNAVGVLNRAEAWLEGRGLDLTTATTSDLTEFLAARRTEVLAVTVAGDQRQLRAFYKWATAGDDPWLDANPARRTPVIKVDQPDPDKLPVLPEWAYKALMATTRARRTRDRTPRCNDRRDAAIIALMWDTGLRRGEVARIDYRHVDFDQATIHLVRTKGRTTTQSRTIPLDEVSFDLLCRYVRMERGDLAGPLFYSTGFVPGTRQRRGITAQAVALMINRRARVANQTQKLPGVLHAPTHSFRRASTINDIDAGMSERSNKIIKGWSDDRMFRHYAKRAETRQAIEESRRIKSGRHLQAAADR